MSNSLLPEVLSELTYSSRADKGVGVGEFLEDLGLVSVVLMCCGEGEGAF